MPQPSKARSGSRRRAGGERRQDLSLFSPTGPFARYAGPALVAGANGVILAANGAADSLAQAIKTGPPAELRTAIDAALAGRPAQLNPLLLPRQGAERTCAIDLTVLPWGEGTAALLIGRDITLDRHLRQTLVEAHERYKGVVDLIADGFAWETDGGGRFVFVAPEGALGAGAQALLHRRARDLVAAGPGKAVFEARRPVHDARLHLRLSDGTVLEVLADAAPIADARGRRTGARGLCRTPAAAAVAPGPADQGPGRREQLLAGILRLTRTSHDATALVAAIVEGLVAALGVAGAAAYRDGGAGFERVALAGTAPPESEVDRLLQRIADGEARVQVEAGASAVVALATPGRDAANGALCLWHAPPGRSWRAGDAALLDELAAQVGDAHQRLAREAELKRLSEMDPLTGLSNRRAFLDALTRRLAEDADAPPAALLYLDLDDFKLVNAHQGHQGGDDVLAAVARLLKGHTRRGDMAARMGGDEFALWLEDIPADAAVQRAETLAAACAGAFAGETGTPDRPLGVSAGVVALGPGCGPSVSALLDCADAAMQRAKKAGKNRVELVQPGD